MTNQTFFNIQSLPKYIDHTLLKPDADQATIAQLCEEALRFGFHSVCVHSVWVPTCKDILAGTGVGIASVCGFPLGANLSDVKAYEAQKAAEYGASEIDMVLQIGLLRSGDEDAVRNDIRQVVKGVEGTALVKVIIETGLLDEQNKTVACRLAEEAGAHFVKTSTGFSGGGATVKDVKLMREHVSAHIGVKASGGIRDLETATAMIRAGATRLGTSSGIAIMQGIQVGAGY